MNGTGCWNVVATRFLLMPIETVSGNPSTVRDDITRNLKENLPDNTICIHVHYTGGTKVMCVETVAAAESIKAALSETIDLETSYLDPRADSGATLVDREGNILVSDTRKRSRAMSCVVLLNSTALKSAHFLYEYRDESGNNQMRNCLAPRPLNEQQLD